ncbi:hypothetical protein [Candidatus Venteria ishoeyi]|uniref:Uncharacterized protein n=1 Tax=Candidatus Venteria ishoeyi TaxID=1899563 RepID=A0A1H6FFS8_9GAMM|nr:hypothetical protein [Candidatus Venteria ishoeyi]MDM8545537.1 hypothetical protein [Candidatus Venteria ishoeyi]SEH08887.1 Uncharacterised protein [Candidatus Venteria ishoeyi]
MAQITNDKALKAALKALPSNALRYVTSLFVENLITEQTDQRVVSAVVLAKNPNMSTNEQLSAFKACRAATIESRTQCGADCNWNEQAAHFIARASAAMIAPAGMCQAADPIWQVVMSCRMAKNCLLIAADDDAVNQENEVQYQIFEAYRRTNS